MASMLILNQHLNQRKKNEKQAIIILSLKLPEKQNQKKVDYTRKWRRNVYIRGEKRAGKVRKWRQDEVVQRG